MYGASIFGCFKNGKDFSQIPTSFEENALIEAVDQGNKSLVEKLISQGADVDKVNNRGYVALHVAVLIDDFACVKLLLSAGANVDKETENGRLTPLHLAAEYGRIQCLKELLTYNANINKKDILGYTPIYRAARNTHTSCVDLLLLHGADPIIPNKDEETVLDYDTTQMIDKLLQKQKNDVHPQQDGDSFYTRHLKPTNGDQDNEEEKQEEVCLFKNDTCSGQE